MWRRFEFRSSGSRGYIIVPRPFVRARCEPHYAGASPRRPRVAGSYRPLPGPGSPPTDRQAVLAHRSATQVQLPRFALSSGSYQEVTSRCRIAQAQPKTAQDNPARTPRATKAGKKRPPRPHLPVPCLRLSASLPIRARTLALACTGSSTSQRWCITVPRSQ